VTKSDAVYLSVTVSAADLVTDEWNGSKSMLNLPPSGVYTLKHLVVKIRFGSEHSLLFTI